MLVDMTGGEKNQTGREMPACQPAVMGRGDMGRRQWGGTGGTAQGQDPRGDRALEPGFWGSWHQRKHTTKFSLVDGSSRLNGRPESQGEWPIRPPKQAGPRCTQVTA